MKKKAEKSKVQETTSIKERNGIIVYGEYIITYIHDKSDDIVKYKLYDKNNTYLAMERNIKNIKKYADSLDNKYYKFKPFLIMYISKTLYPMVLKVNSFNVEKGRFNTVVVKNTFNKNREDRVYTNERVRLSLMTFNRDCFDYPLSNMDNKRIQKIIDNRKKAKTFSNKAWEASRIANNYKEKIKKGNKVKEMYKKFYV